jgi:disulfide bond formation protein DsbB
MLDKLATKVITEAKTAGGSAWYWLAIIVVGVVLEGSALYYQYALNYYPCVLCIHVRIWVMGAILAGVFGLLARHSRPALLSAHAFSVVMFAGLLERSYMTLAVERLWTEGSCSMDAGLPSWFALDQWFPAIFEVQEACGYTPEVIFGITMAEALVVLAAGAVVVSLVMLGSAFRR